MRTVCTACEGTGWAPEGLKDVEYRGIQVLPLEHLVVINGEAIGLSPAMTRLMTALVEARGRVVTHSAVEVAVTRGQARDSNVGEVQISNLRRRLGRHSHLIRTVHGEGYRLDVQ